jgi:membrane protein EpsK
MQNQINKNLITNSVNLLVNIVIGIIYTPYLVNNLGIATYGLIPLALIINQYILVITESLTGSLTRFYTIYIRKKEYELASKNLSTSFFLLITIIIILLPFFITIIKDINSIFNIPANSINNAKTLFSFTLLSFSCSLISSLFNITLYSNNRLDLINLIKIIRNSGKVVFVILFFTISNKNIIYIGYSNFITEIIVLVISFMLFKKTKLPNIIITWKFIDFYNFKIVLIMTCWVIIQRLGDTTLYRIDNIIINNFFGITKSGILGTITEFGSYITNVILVISSIFGPLVLIEFANKNHSKIKSISFDAVWITGTMCSIVVGLVMAFSTEIITLWLGNKFAPYAIWLSVKVISLPFITSSIVFAYVFRAWNLIKIPALITIGLGLINIIISVLLAIKLNGNNKIIIILLCSNAVINIIQSYVFSSIYFKKIYKDTNIKLFAIYGIQFITIMLLSVILSYGFRLIINTNSFFYLLFSMAGVASISTTIVWFLFMSKKRKVVTLRYFKKLTNR